MYIPQSIRFLKRRVLRNFDGPRVIRREYRKFHGKELADHPETLTEKLYHRMISVHRNGNPTFTRLADKYLARDYVRDKVGEEYLVDLIWHGADPEKIPFEDLPEVCMAKTNHASGMTMIIRQPADHARIASQFRTWLNINYYWQTREFQYYGIKPQILIEQLLDDGHSDGPLDYRFWCFSGKPEMVQVDNNNHSINPMYDLEWKRLALKYRPKAVEQDVPQPPNLNRMIEIARKLSADFDFVRVDLYNVNGKIYVGELTFTPAIGQLPFEPKSWDLELGQKWQ